MNKRFKTYAIVWAILFALYNIVCFVSPEEIAGYNKYGGAFWGGYAFITAAFIGQLACAYFALKTDDKTRLFYNLPLIRISYIGLIVTMIAGGVCMAVPDLPNWIAIILCAAVLAFTTMAVVKANAAADVVENIDTKVSTNTMFIKSLTADAESLMARATPESKAACKKVFEAIRYSDPMSNDALVDVENQIRQKFNEFSNAAAEGIDSIDTIADELVVLIGDRNNKCKLLK